MAGDVSIRAAVPDDKEAVAELTRELGYAASGEQAAERLSALLADSRERVLVAVADGAIAGWIHLGEVASLESDRFVEIRGLVVTQTLRGRGIGSQLIERAELWARDRGIGRVRIRSNVVRTATRNFYERRGYVVTKNQNVFDKSLP